jgi:hypothetical protein
MADKSPCMYLSWVLDAVGLGDAVALQFEPQFRSVLASRWCVVLHLTINTLKMVFRLTASNIQTIQKALRVKFS